MKWGEVIGFGFGNHMVGAIKRFSESRIWRHKHYTNWRADSQAIGTTKAPHRFSGAPVRFHYQPESLTRCAFTSAGADVLAPSYQPRGSRAIPVCCLHIYIPQSRTSACGGGTLSAGLTAAPCAFPCSQEACFPHLVTLLYSIESGLSIVF